MSKTKAEWIKHHKKLHIIQHNIKEHDEQAKKIHVSQGGSPQEASKDGLHTDWRDVIHDARGALAKSRKRSRKRGKAIFR